MVFDVSQNDLIEKTAEELKKVLDMPSWAHFAKTGNHKQRPPADHNWWYMRAAAILRTVYLRGPVGVSKLRTKYGGRKNRGVKPEKFVRGSGSVARKILQQLEQAELVKQEKKTKHKGRVITPKGVSLLFTIAKRLRGPAKPKPKAPVAPKQQPKEVVKQEHKEVVKKEAPKKQQKSKISEPQNTKSVLKEAKVPEKKKEPKAAPKKEAKKKK